MLQKTGGTDGAEDGTGTQGRELAFRWLPCHHRLIRIFQFCLFSLFGPHTLGTETLGVPRATAKGLGFFPLTS